MVAQDFFLGNRPFQTSLGRSLSAIFQKSSLLFQTSFKRSIERSVADGKAYCKDFGVHLLLFVYQKLRNYHIRFEKLEVVCAFHSDLPLDKL